MNKNYATLKRQYLESITGEEELPPVIGYITKKEEIIILSQEKTILLFDDFKPQMASIMQKFFESPFFDGELDTFFYMNEIYYKKMTHEEVAEKGMPGSLKDDKLAEEAVCIYEETEEGITQTIFPILYDSENEGRTLDQEFTSADVKRGTKEFEELVDNSRLAGFWPTK